VVSAVVHLRDPQRGPVAPAPPKWGVLRSNTPALDAWRSPALRETPTGPTRSGGSPSRPRAPPLGGARGMFFGCISPLWPHNPAPQKEAPGSIPPPSFRKGGATRPPCGGSARPAERGPGWGLSRETPLTAGGAGRYR